VSSVNRSSSRSAISLGVSARARAAASSMASGMPSSCRQISTTAAAFPTVKAKPGRACAARSSKRRTASAAAASSGRRSVPWVGSPREGTRQVTSPSTPRGSRLVARTRTRGAAWSTWLTRSAVAARTCSQLSAMSRRSRSVRYSTTRAATRPVPTSCSPHAAPTVGATCSGRVSGASSASHTPSVYRSSRREPTSMARRVLPHPPTPTSVTSRWRVTRVAISLLSGARPTKLEIAVGRLCCRHAAGVIAGTRRGPDGSWVSTAC